MRAFALIGMVALSACSLVEEAPGEAAERNISGDLSELFEGIDVGPAANCVRDHATESELAILSQDNIDTKPLTRQIFERDATLGCLQANGVIEVVNIVEVVE